MTHIQMCCTFAYTLVYDVSSKINCQNLGQQFNFFLNFMPGNVLSTKKNSNV